MLAHKSGSGPLPRSGPDDSREEAALLARVAAGEAEAFRGLVDRHLPSVLAVARRMLRDDAEAEDVAQDTLLRLWRNAGGLELGPGGVRPWLRRVVSNLCIDRVRARRNTTVVEAVPEDSEPPTQFRQLAERELGARVDAALKALPERQRLALTLFHYEGMSQIEVGEAMGISDEAVELLLARARRTLKVSLKENGGGSCPRTRYEGEKKTGAEMTNTSNTMTIAELERLLDVYGSDRTRWPVEARASAGHLAARDRAARRLLAEAEALDRALERAPLPTLAQEAAMAERIVAAARRTPRIVAGAGVEAGRPPITAGDNVVQLPALRGPRQWLSAKTAFGGVASALAASLALGVFLGLSSLSQGVLPAVEQMTGIPLGSNGPVVAQIDLLDEDLL